MKLRLAIALRMGFSWILLGSAVRAGPVEKSAACLRRADLGCAQEIRDGVMSSDPDGLEALRVELEVAFYEGRFDASVHALDTMVERGVSINEEQEAPYRASAAAAEGFVDASGPSVKVRYSRGVDRILVEEALATLESARFTYDGLFGGGPNHTVVLDVFPTASRFIDASGLPPEAVRATGVVALSKWSRLLITSPRALARGYAWKDTVAHEYIHLVVAHRSGDRVPVWLQEGLAKHLEGYWRDEVTGHLKRHHQSLLAKAVATGEFVPFEKFRHSMAYLDSGEEAALAFAQVATMVQYMLEKAGTEALPPLLGRIQGGEEPELVVADLAGHAEFGDFRAGWLEWLKTQPLVQEELESLPVVLDGEGGDFAGDPLLSQRTDLARFARLGDLLLDIGRPQAALVEYQKAQDPEEPASPLLLARQARCYLDMNRADDALVLMDEAISLYPEFTLVQVTRGRSLDALGRTQDALVSWNAAHDLNPFDPEVQSALVDGYDAIGQTRQANRHRKYAEILASGGVVLVTENAQVSEERSGDRDNAQDEHRDK